MEGYYLKVFRVCVCFLAYGVDCKIERIVCIFNDIIGKDNIGFFVFEYYWEVDQCVFYRFIVVKCYVNIDYSFGWQGFKWGCCLEFKVIQQQIVICIDVYSWVW